MFSRCEWRESKECTDEEQQKGHAAQQGERDLNVDKMAPDIIGWKQKLYLPKAWCKEFRKKKKINKLELKLKMDKKHNC